MCCLGTACLWPLRAHRSQLRHHLKGTHVCSAQLEPKNLVASDQHISWPATSRASGEGQCAWSPYHRPSHMQQYAPSNSIETWTACDDTHGIPFLYKYAAEAPMTYRCTRLLQAQWCWRHCRQQELQLTRRTGTVLRSSARERQRPQHHLLCAWVKSAGGLGNDEYTNQCCIPLDRDTALVDVLKA